MTFGIIPACGHSTRMGRPKLSLPLGDRTVIEHVVRALLDGGVEGVLVVVGPHVPELESLAMRAGARVLTFSEPTPDMRATVEAGLDWLESHFRPAADDWWLLAPGDHPTLAPATVRTLLDAARADAGHSIFVPAWGGRRGHPLMASWRHAAGVRALPPGEGVNSYLKRNPEAVREVVVTDVSGLHDLDTPDDYARLLRHDSNG
ncbi:MAG: NTP transferase domain-containing protein [Gemmataceae bacterium]